MDGCNVMAGWRVAMRALPDMGSILFLIWNWWAIWNCLLKKNGIGIDKFGIEVCYKTIQSTN